MAPKHGDDTYNFKTMDWQEYMAYRPIYPEALYRLIYDHHTAQNGGFDTALDIGGGIGIVTTELLTKFSHVTLSDPSELYLQQARPVFAAVPEHRISYLQCSAEDIKPSDLSKGPVDLVTAAESLHWANLDLCMPRIVEVLKPGGTFAAWVYGTRAVYPASDPARAAYDRAYDKWVTLFEDNIQKQSKTTAGAVMNARFDSMPFDPTQWRNVRRFHVHPAEWMCSERYPVAESRVLPENETLENYHDNALLHQSADYAWVEGYLHNLVPPLNFRETAAEELKQLKTAMADRTVQMEWAVGIVLATKK